VKFGHLEILDNVDFSLPAFENNFGVKSKIDFKELNFYFGAPVWGDKNYIGVLYPKGTKQNKFLHEYAKQFNSIEVNATRFGTPKPVVLDNWKSAVSNEFKFSLKVPQVITHRKDINDIKARHQIDKFILAIDHLGNNSGISFAVMANYFKASQFKMLVEFVQNIPIDMPFSIEFRDPSWFAPSIMNEWQSLFVENNIGTVITDTPGRRDVAHCRLSGDNLFVRYVGNFNHISDTHRIKIWVDKIIESTSFGIKNVWFYVHQPGDDRGRVVDFFNTFINELKLKNSKEITLLKDYRL